MFVRTDLDTLLTALYVLVDGRNVAALSAAPRVRAKEGRTLTVDQARQLLDAAHDHRIGLPVQLALVYGLRRGEVLGLQWSALDWAASTPPDHPQREADQDAQCLGNAADPAGRLRTKDAEVEGARWR